MIYLNVINIVAGTSVDGPGLRTSIYFAGCSHHCPGCHNPQTWDPAAGVAMSIDEIISIIEENDFDVTFTGGDPLYQVTELSVLAQKVKSNNRNIWCYTGYRYEELIKSSTYSNLLNQIDILVDGRFELEKRDTGLRFRGSSNQRIIDVKRSIYNNEVTLWQPSIL